jgi:uncharacterized protein YjiS (DUF1127 family)
MQLYWHGAEQEWVPAALSAVTNSHASGEPILRRTWRAGWLARMWTTLRRWRRRAWERDELAQLSAHDLHDLGISKAEVWAEGRKWFWQE